MPTDPRASAREFRIPTAGLALVFSITTLAFALMLFKHLSYPLIWHDEGDTVMFGVRILEHGYPVVHGPRNIVYGLKQDLSIGVRAESDAYIGSPWLQYYFATIGVALARGVDDFYAKTARLRLPFALIGAAGLAVLLGAILPAVGRDARRRWWCAIAFVALSTCSISLILHLREARYYSLVVFLGSCLVALHVRHVVFRSLGTAAYGCGLVVLLFLLLNTFYPAFGVFGVALGLDLVLRARFAASSGGARLRWLLRAAWPLGVAAILAVPFVVFFRLFTVTGNFMEANDATALAYLENLGKVLYNLARFEFLVPALAAKLGVLALSRGARDEPEGLRQRRQISGFLTLLLLTWWLVVSRTPFIFERYFVLLGPVLIAMLIVDVSIFLDLWRGQARSWRSGLAAAAIALCTAASLVVRLPELEGRVYEIRHQYLGPLDYVIPYLAGRYEDPSRLVIATNYEGPAYMYYLGSHATVGYFGPDLERDSGIQPDVIVPRRWKDNYEVLEALEARGHYERVNFPVTSLRMNNIPELSHQNPGGIVHHFETHFPQNAGHRLFLLERVADR
jgi:hypothetical protein